MERTNMIFEYRNIPIHYSISGNGKPLVLLHGFLESAVIWEEAIRVLTNDFKVIVLDLPGHGKSRFISETQSMELHAQVVKALLQFLKIEQPIVLGHSMGGYVALSMISLFPNLLAGILLLNSTPQADTPERKKNRDRALKIIDTEKNTFISMGISNLFSEKARQRFNNEIAALKETAFQFPKEGILANIKGMRDRKDYTKTLLAFTNPKFILAGRQDPIIPFEQAKEDARNTHATLVALSGSHMGWLENWSEIVKILYLIDKK